MLLGRMLCQLMDQIQPKKVNTLELLFWFLYILLILCLLNVSKKYYHDKGSDQWHAQHKIGLDSVY